MVMAWLEAAKYLGFQLFFFENPEIPKRRVLPQAYHLRFTAQYFCALDLGSSLSSSAKSRVSRQKEEQIKASERK